MNYKLFALLGGIYLALPSLLLAGGVPTDFEPLVGIPGLDNRNSDFNNYINALYALSISVAALIAVIQIVLGGAQYMMDDLISSKSAAKERIRNALIGLLIIIGAVLILSTLNEDLTNFEIVAEPVFLDPNIPTIPEGQTRDEYCRGINCSIVPCDSNFLVSIGGNNIPSDTDAECRSVCEDLPSGQFFITSDTDGNERSECAYVRDIALECDPDSNIYCCEGLNRGNFDEYQNMCESGSLGIDIITCEHTVTNPDINNTSYDADCTSAISECNAQLGEVISEKEYDGSNFASIACLTNEDTKNETLARVISELCPDGENCVAETCDLYQPRGDSWVPLEGCSGACSNLEGYYDETTSICVFEEEKMPQTIQMNCINLGSSVGFDCSVSRDRCAEVYEGISTISTGGQYINCEINS